VRRGQLDHTNHENRECRVVTPLRCLLTKISTLATIFFLVSSFSSPASPTSPFPGIAEEDSEGSEIEAELEEDWFEDIQDAQPMARATARRLATTANEVCTSAYLCNATDYLKSYFTSVLCGSQRSKPANLPLPL
jgi:hypothetical protein